MIGFNNVNNIKYVLSILFYEGGLSEERNSKNSSDNRNNNWKVSHIVIKINININKVFLTIK